MKFGKTKQESDEFRRECEEGKHDSRCCVFALLPKYCRNTARYVWLETVWRVQYYWVGKAVRGLRIKYEEIAQ